MGGGSYSYSSHVSSIADSGYKRKSVHQVFTSRDISKEMNPKGVRIRESRDSEEHPDSFPIIINLDLTGSMGTVPKELIQDGLPTLMNEIINAGIKDPQVLFVGVGDHECDNAPLQVGQFESSDPLLDHWLKKVYLEGGGGGNEGESYLLAWYFAGRHTAIDSLEKRGKKGILFTIGDEPTLRNVPGTVLKELMGEGQFGDETHVSLLEEARKKYHVYHIHIRETYAGSMDSTIEDWRQILGDNVIVAQNHSEVAHIIADLTKKAYAGGNGQQARPEPADDQPDEEGGGLL